MAVSLLLSANISTKASYAVVVLFLFCTTLILVDYAHILWRRRKLPPGPVPWPIFGNHFQIPNVRPWLAWEEWAKHYKAPLMTLWIGREPRIIVSDAWVASELMEKKSDVFSSRPRLVVMGDAINATKNNQTTLAYGDRWRLHRKLMVSMLRTARWHFTDVRLQHAAVGSQVARDYRSFQADEAKILVRDLFLDPSNFEPVIERYTISVTSIIGWGRRVDRINDYVAQQALAMMESVNYVIPGVYILETLPWLMNMPRWLYKFPSWLRQGAAIFGRYFYLLTQEASTSENKNFGIFMLDSQMKHNLNELEVAGLMGNLVGGGVDTTSSTMLSCILAMAVFPEVQRKVQAEIDSVVGDQRSPDWSDIDGGKLPYLGALVKEILRWRTVTVLAGIPHANSEDVEYNGYHFPKGTNFTGNMWAIHRNPREYPDPDIVRPERFLNGLERPYPNSRGSNPFGWGRRQCSGQPVAEQGLLFSLGRMLWAFDIAPGLDEKVGQVVFSFYSIS